MDYFKQGEVTPTAQLSVMQSKAKHAHFNAVGIGRREASRSLSVAREPQIWRKQSMSYDGGRFARVATARDDIASSLLICLCGQSGARIQRRVKMAVTREKGHELQS